MLAIKLARVGRKNAPTYRVVVTPKTRDPWAKSVEIIGNYNPRMTPSALELNKERAAYWLSVGAQPTDTVWNLFVAEGLIKEKKRAISSLTTKRQGKMTAEKQAAIEAEAEKKAKAEAEKKAAEEAKAAEAAKTEGAPPEAPAEEAAS